MKILLDEQLPVKLKFRLAPDFDVSTVKDENWLGVKNGGLIRLAQNSGFNIFITNDQSLGFQQILSQYQIIFININKPSNRYDDVLPVLLQIKRWLLKNGSNLHQLEGFKNYLTHPTDFDDIDP